jgi:glucokinase
MAVSKTTKKKPGRQNGYLIGVNIGVRSTQVGAAELNGDVIFEDTFETVKDPAACLVLIQTRIETIIQNNTDREAKIIAVVVPGIVDKEKGLLVESICLGWKNVDIAKALPIGKIPISIENDAAAAAHFEAKKIGDNANFILVRSGTSIGVCVVEDGKVEADAEHKDLAALFGHMTIVAGGKLCECGNRGCWEKYASAASAASLYLGDRPPARGESIPRFNEIVSKAENGDIRSRRTLEKIGDHLGLGIANVIMGIGIPHVIISGRLVNGWEFIREPMLASVNRSVVGRLGEFSIEPGSSEGSALGGALAVAAEVLSSNSDK